MKNYLTLMLLVVTSSLIATPHAQALELGVLGGLNFSKTSQNISPATWGTSPGLALGASLDISSVIPLPLFGFEVDALWVNRKLDVVLANIDSTTSNHYLMIPALIRFTGLPVISLGVGPYLAFPLDTSNNASTDFGLLASLRLKHEIAPMIHGVLDGRYILGLTDANGSQNTKFRDVQVLAGVSGGF